ncbi:MAG: alpha/beta hydrolase [Xylophilus ampelinus]
MHRTHRPTVFRRPSLLASLPGIAALMLAGCGGSGGAPEPAPGRGSLVVSPPAPVADFTAAQLAARLAADPQGQALLQLAGAPRCGVEARALHYRTVGAQGEATDSTGVLMRPTGTDAACQGARPIVLYAHGTATDRRYNLAAVADAGNPATPESSLLAAMYAAQGFTVVAPNYAGYDASALAYHPYLNADQQSKDMIDALTAARTALQALGTPDAGPLFLTGYSQGGHVAMATHRALQAQGTPVAASAPISGPYALAAMGDALFYGSVNLGATVFAPLIVTSYQQAYGNLYRSTSDIYSSFYSQGIDRLLPATVPVDTLVAQGRLPASAMFDSTPPQAPPGSGLQRLLDGITPPSQPAGQAALFAMGFGPRPLLNNNARLGYLMDAMANPDGAAPALTTGLPAAAPADPLRQAFKRNDLRDWSPRSPVLLCGGNADPIVFYGLNTQTMARLWTPPSALAPATTPVVALDVDSQATGAGDPYAALKAGFAQAKASVAAAGGANAVLASYHAGLVPPFCSAAARAFFQSALAARS